MDRYCSNSWTREATDHESAEKVNTQIYEWNEESLAVFKANEVREELIMIRKILGENGN